MRIALINGSPKVNKSSSKVLVEDLKYYLNEHAEIIDCEMHINSTHEKAIAALKTAEIWVFVFPLYVDGIPGHLLSFLAQLEEKPLRAQKVNVYGVVNCGFYEGIQNELALKILQNWCKKAGYIWNGGVGVGGGGGLSMLPDMKKGHGPKAPIDKALKELADKMVKTEKQGNKFVSVGFPRFMYRIGAQMGWRQMVKANGGKVKDLGKRLE